MERPQVERALWRRTNPLVLQQYFIFDERKQVFHVVDGALATEVLELYDSTIVYDGVKARLINCFEMSDTDGKEFTHDSDALRVCYSSCFTPEFYPRSVVMLRF